MPRAKRALSETDVNARSGPVSKRKPVAKKAALPTDNNGKVNKGASLGPVPKKERVIEKTSFTAPETPLPDAPPTDQNGKVLASAHDHTWICICRARDDIIRELGPEDHDKYEQTCGRAGKCVCRKPAISSPEHHWIVTKKGYELAQEWKEQEAKRDQESPGMFIFNKWSGYGICEVIENMFLAFAREARRAKKDAMAMWSQIEGMALFLGRDVRSLPRTDAQGNAKRLMLIGTALLTAINEFIRQDLRRRHRGQEMLFKNASSEIRNLGLIISYFLQFAHENSDTCRLNEDGWKHEVIRLTDEHNVSIQGLAGIDNVIDEIRKRKNDGDDHGNEADILDTIADTIRTSGVRAAADACAMQTMSSSTDFLVNVEKCYKSEEIWGLMTIEKMTQGTRRSWSQSDYNLELGAYKSHQAVKVGPCGPEYGGQIGGKFYDLTAQRNKGSHMKQYRI